GARVHGLLVVRRHAATARGAVVGEGERALAGRPPLPRRDAVAPHVLHRGPTVPFHAGALARRTGGNALRRVLSAGLSTSRMTTQEEVGEPEATIIDRASHSIPRRRIPENVLKVLYRLHRSGYRAYLCGGSVRDLLMNRPPKDFDVATDAHPMEIRRLFRNSRIIGRRFRLVHVLF